LFQKQHFYSPFSRVQAGAIAGGVVGGIAVITAVVVALLFCRRKPRPVEFNEQPTVMPFSQYNVEQPPPVPPPRQNTMANVSTSAPPVSATSPYLSGVSNNSTSQQQSPTSPSSADFLMGRSISPSSQGGDSHIDGTLSWRPGPPSNAPAPSSSSNQLNDEQAGYVQNLYSLNVPAPAIAVVVDRMLREGRTHTLPAESSDFGGDFKRQVTTVANPPRYQG